MKVVRRADELQVGDEVLDFSGGQGRRGEFTVLEVYPSEGTVTLWGTNPVFGAFKVTVPNREEFLLIRRPRPEREGEDEMRARVIHRAMDVVYAKKNSLPVEPAIKDLYKAIEAYELGKPAEGRS